MDDLDMDFYRRDRKKYAAAVINSPSRKKLIIAGPGTGKTYIFKSLLGKIKHASGEEGLVLTFIKNLVADLKVELAALAKVSTFHAFCKSIVHSFKNDMFEYYPNILRLIEKDFDILELEKNNNEDIERCFFGLKSGEVIESTLKIGDYYNAAGHSDSVYRVIRYYEAYPNRIPIYPLIIFDEYQDFNYLEISLVKVLSKKSPLLIVGDDDQALYAFKQASPDYIRRLVQDHEFHRFELPYCSRCTRVIVEAVKKIVCIAKKNGYLEGRVDKPFKYFPPDKQNDSERHPLIIDVNCTVERKDCHYIGKFIAKEISEIPLSYIRDSSRRHEPTALIIGPGQFLDGVRIELKRKFGYVADKKQGDDVIDILDGYRSVVKNPKSRLGWRILLHCDPCENSDKMIKKAISEERDIFDLISSKEYASKHQRISNAVNKIMCGDDLNAAERKSIETALGLSPQEVIAKLMSDKEEGPKAQEQDQEKEIDMPDILCTSFEGSKGLAAQYVFIVGVNEKHFPQKTPPSNKEIYKLIVALTRTRKRCYMISCNIFAGEALKPSIYKAWLKDELTKEIFVDKKFINKFCN
jgi:superfamily I DNA/RNA helicase